LIMLFFPNGILEGLKGWVRFLIGRQLRGARG
jgi:hypothetical protein